MLHAVRDNCHRTLRLCWEPCWNKSVILRRSASFNFPFMIIHYPFRVLPWQSVDGLEVHSRLLVFMYVGKPIAVLLKTYGWGFGSSYGHTWPCKVPGDLAFMEQG
jgi:hypothetical protein